VFLRSQYRGTTTAEKLRGTNTAALAWELDAGGDRPSPPAVRVWGFTPQIFLKTQMLNPAFWWLLAAKFLAFWKLQPRGWGRGPIHCWSPNSWGTSLPRSLRLLCLLTFVAHKFSRISGERELPLIMVFRGQAGISFTENLKASDISGAPKLCPPRYAVVMPLNIIELLLLCVCVSSA